MRGRPSRKEKLKMDEKHDHSHDTDYSRAHPERHSCTPYHPGVRGCKECQDAADDKNSHLEKASKQE